MILIFTIFALSSCIFDDGKITVTRFGGGGSGVALAKVTSVSIVNDQLVVNGTDLNGVTGVRITGPSSFDESFSIESKSAANLIANGLGNVAFAMNGLFNLILTDAQGAATFQVTFTLQDGAVTASKLSDMGAGVGQILKYNGTSWVPSDLSALTYAGNWNGTANTPDLSSGGSNGEYYIVNNAGTFDLSGGPGTNSWAIGDWVVWNNVDGRWEKVDNATNVTSFNSRSGVVTPQTGDYTWAQINKTSSVLSEIADIDAPAGDGSDTGKVLKWNNATSRWELGDDLSGGGSGSVTSTEIANGAIVNEDVNVAAAIDQSKIANLTTDLAAKVPLAGGTMTGDLTVPNLVTSGSVDGVDVSTLAASVGTNTTNIGNNATAISNLDTDDVAEATALYFTDARAKASAVVNSTAGTETDQAASVSSMKSYVTTAISGFGGGDFLADGTVPMTGNLDLGNNKLRLKSDNANYVEMIAPNTLGATYTLTMPADDGTVGQVLSTDGSGVLSWANSATGTVTNVTGTAPIVSSGGATPAISIAQANGATDGFLDSADWTTFNNKQAAITTGSTAQYLRGDLTLATLQDDVRSTLLTGYASSAGTVAATDTIIQAFNKLNGNTAANTTAISGLDTDDISEATALYFTDARARAAAVLNVTTGSETDQAASVAAMKSYVASNAGTGDINDGGNSNAATVTIGTNDANSLAFETNGSTAMTILSGGNVGIGVTSPTENLDIRGSGIVSLAMQSTDASSESFGFDMRSGTTSQARIMYDNSIIGTFSNNGLLLGGSQDAGTKFHLIGNNGTETTQLTAVDQFNIIFDCGLSSGSCVLNRTSGIASTQDAGTPNLRNIDYHASMDHRFFLTGAANPNMVITDNGLVGIGTESPNRLLEVAGPVRVTATALPSSPAAGDIAVDSGDSNRLKWYDGSTWQGAGAPGGTITSVGVTAPIASTGGTTPTLSMAQANGSTDGFLDSADWTTFNSKQAAITTGATTQYLRGDLSLATLQDDVRSTLLTGFSSGAGTVVAGDTVLQAIQKIDGNIAAISVPSDTDGLSEGSTNLYFTDARARTAAVLNVTTGSETDQAASVAAMKTYVASNSGTGDINDGGNTNAATVTIGTNDANSLAFETNNSTAMTILSGGNVGIGTTSPIEKFQIGPTWNFRDGSTKWINYNLDYQTGSTWNHVTTNGASQIGFTQGGAISFSTYPSSSAGTGISQKTAMILNNSGNLGIGTTGPSARLEVLGNLSTSLTGTVDVTSGTSTVTGTGTSFDTELNVGDAIEINSEVFTVSAIGSATTLTLDSNHSTGATGVSATSDTTILSLNTGDSRSLLNIDKSGLMTINGSLALQESSGTDSINIRSPASIATSYTLTLPTTDGASGEVLTTDGSGALSWAPADAATSVSAGAGAAGTPSMSFSTDSNTGFYSSGADQIGIASNGVNTFNFTSTALSSPTTGGASITTGDGTAAAPTFSFAGDEDTGWFRAAANELAAATGGSERVRIDSAGNVGIGTTDPISKLHIFENGSNSLQVPLVLQNNDSTNTGGSATGIGFRVANTATYKSAIAFERQASNSRGSLHFLINNVADTSTAAGLSDAKMTIDSSGNVGIGTTNPENALEIHDGAVGESTHLSLSNSNNSQFLKMGINADVAQIAWDNGDSMQFGLLDDDNADTTLTPLMTISNSGNVGIGTTAPLGTLHTYSLNASFIDRIANGSHLLLRRGNGTEASPTAVVSSNTIGALTFGGHDGTGWVNPATGVSAIASENWNGTSHGTDLVFTTTANTTLTATERMRIDDLGNVGIGTNDPEDKLHIEDGGIFIRGSVDLAAPVATGDSFRLFQQDDSGNGDPYGTGSNSSIIFENQDSSQANPDDGMFFFNTGSDNVPEVALSILGDGDVGVGTTSPDAALHVSSPNTTTAIFEKQSAGIDIASAVVLKKGNTLGAGADGIGNRMRFDIETETEGVFETSGYFQFEATDATAGTVDSDFQVFPRLDGSPVSDAFIVKSSGNVGVGTINPSANFEVERSTAATAIAIFDDNTAANNFSDVEIEAFKPGYVLRDSSTSAADFRMGLELNKLVFSIDTDDDGLKDTNSNFDDVPAAMSILSSGRVGIGTASPSYGLDVQANDGTAAKDTYIRIKSDGGTGDADAQLILDAADTGESGIVFRLDGLATGDSLIYRNNGNNDLHFGTNDASRMMIDGTGNVGIGTSSPGTKLHVDGYIFSGSTYNSSPANNNVVGAIVRDDGIISVNRSAGIPMYLGRTDDGTILNFRSAGASIGSISVSGATVTYGAFTGVHYGYTNQELKLGQLVRLGDNHRYPSSIEEGIREPLYELESSIKKNSNKVFGSYVGLLNPGKPFDEVDNPHNFMAVGNGEVLVVNKGKDLKVGDYLISSDIPGYAELDTGKFDTAHIIARVVENISWDDVTDEVDGTKFKRVSVTFENFDKVYGNEKNLEMFKLMQNGIDTEQDRKIASLEEKLEKVETENKEMKNQLDGMKEILCSMKPDSAICKTK